MARYDKSLMRVRCGRRIVNSSRGSSRGLTRQADRRPHPSSTAPGPDVTVRKVTHILSPTPCALPSVGIIPHTSIIPRTLYIANGSDVFSPRR